MLPVLIKKIFFFIIIFLQISFSFAHGDDGHNENFGATNKAGSSYFSVSSVSNIFELVLRYEPIEAGSLAKFKLFVSDFSTNLAIDSAKIEITAFDNDKLIFVVKQIELGIYSVEGTFPENKGYNLVANISYGDKVDLILIKGIEVGKKLSLPEEEKIETSFFSWKLLFVFIAGMVFSLIIIRFFMKN